MGSERPASAAALSAVGGAVGLPVIAFYRELLKAGEDLLHQLFERWAHRLGWLSRGRVKR